MDLSPKDIRHVTEFVRKIAKAPHIETIVSEAFATLHKTAGVRAMRIVYSGTRGTWKEWSASVNSVEVRSHDEWPPAQRGHSTAVFDFADSRAGYVSVDKKSAKAAQMIELMAPQVWSAVLLHSAIQRVEKASLSETEMVRETIRARDEERRHIARELHDDMGQSMASLKLALKWTEDMVRTGSNGDEIVKELENARDAVGSMLSRMRDLSHTLYPRMLDTLGLVATLRELVEQMAEHSSLEVNCIVRGKERPLQREKAMALYRCCQEAVSNAIRHADASKIDIRILFREKEVHVSVEDNGKGFDPRTLYDSNKRLMSSGFWTIRQRMADLNGAFRVSTADRKGTVVEMVLFNPQRKINGKGQNKTAHRR
jgi:signal transduction histidine kinase